jgi:hypothetical protein
MSPRSARVALALLAGLAALPLLSAWKFIVPPRKWNEQDMPIRYYIGEEPAPGLSLDETELNIRRSFDQWRDVRCSPVDSEFADWIPNDPSFGQTQRSQITFNGDLESGVLAATVTHANDNVLSNNAYAFYEVTAMNIIFNSGTSWGTPEEIADPGCFGRLDFVGTTSHEIGHGLGLGHSCDNGEPCEEPVLRQALMFWTAAGACSDARQGPKDDDIAGFNTIYGVSVDFELEASDGGDLVGSVPFDVTVRIPEDFQSDRYDDYEWNFGDGSEHVMQENDGEVEPVTHTYGEEGQFTITLKARGDDAECGGAFEAENRRVGAVLVCGEPAPSFQYENLGDYTVQLRNTSDLSTFGCVTGFEWVLDGSEASALRTYEPKFTFEEAGEHEVTLRATGPGGEAEATGSITVTKQAEAGCNASFAGRTGARVLAALAAVLAIAATRRLLRRRATSTT